ncbi:MAG: PilN domain-containing protein [Betaproteobacteria bacterium]|nr:PilN domain-containing protein [Betaproteobacteria bacterium]
MSQQINLLLPELRPRFDWLALPVVAGTALAGLMLVVILASVSISRLDALKARENAIRIQLAGLQQQVQVLGQRLGARKADSSLDQQLEAARLAVGQRKEVLNVVAQGNLPVSHAYSGLLQGFSRQVVEGVWLTGFGFAQKSIEIHGRLTDPALLPVYIGRLNAEPAFAGRRFATLDMKGIDPTAGNRETPANPAQAKVPMPRHTEFSLRTAAEKAR